jgi:hypothetical protein
MANLIRTPTRLLAEPDMGEYSIKPHWQEELTPTRCSVPLEMEPRVERRRERTITERDRLIEHVEYAQCWTVKGSLNCPILSVLKLSQCYVGVSTTQNTPHLTPNERRGRGGNKLL